MYLVKNALTVSQKWIWRITWGGNARKLDENFEENRWKQRKTQSIFWNFNIFPQLSSIFQNSFNIQLLLTRSFHWEVSMFQSIFNDKFFFNLQSDLSDWHKKQFKNSICLFSQNYRISSVTKTSFSSEKTRNRPETRYASRQIDE